METMILIAREITPPSFAAYLEFGCLSAARPGELDALRWPWVRFEDDEIDIREQWSAKVRKFTAPKYGPYTIALVARARELLLNMPRAEVDSQFVFLTNRGHHYTPSSRTHHSEPSPLLRRSPRDDALPCDSPLLRLVRTQRP